MTVDDLPWAPHPYLSEIEQARFFGHSILRGTFEILYSKYEVRDHYGDIHRFDNDEALLDFLKERLPGCFICEGE